ncbi:hypothetical protein C6P44_000712 [Monosporozyma unispora]|nr:hypothetical protein C6P44_000712 [Kazachstania unispora]
MDLLKELEAKKERLRLLRERRRQTSLDYEIHETANTNVKPLTETNNVNAVKMVDASTQTDEQKVLLQENKFKQMLPPIQVKKSKPEVVTYDHGIQTDPIEVYEVKSERSKDRDDRQNDKTEQEAARSNEEHTILFDFPDLKPFAISAGYGASESNQVESFASHWYSRGENINQSQSSNKNKDQLGIIKLHSCPIKEIDSSQNFLCQSIDYDSTRHITMASFILDDTNSLSTIPKSYTYVIDTFTDTIIDKIELLGQQITRNLILRKFETHNIISMLILTQRGKTLLYELKKTSQGTLIKWNRNIISKNYHLGCDYLFAIWESKFKLVTGDSQGFISILNSLDISQDKLLYGGNSNNNTTDSQVIQVIPPATNLLYTTEEKDYIVQRFVDEYLSKLVIFNEINITALVGSPFNDECIFLGTEDGGIYKVLLNAVDKNKSKITLDLENNGFLPVSSKNSNTTQSDETELNEQQSITKTIFHNGYITAISMEPSGLLLSSSVDWIIKLWDIKDNQQLDSIDLQKPVLSVDWILDNSNKNPFEDKYICFAMTWDAIYIIQWFVDETIDTDEDKKNRKHFHKQIPATIIKKVEIDQFDLSMQQFTACTLVIDTKVESQINALLILTGDSSIIEYVQVAIEPH